MRPSGPIGKVSRVRCQRSGDWLVEYSQGSSIRCCGLANVMAPVGVGGDLDRLEAQFQPAVDVAAHLGYSRQAFVSVDENEAIVV